MFILLNLDLLINKFSEREQLVDSVVRLLNIEL